MRPKKRIIIQLDDEHTAEETCKEVARLLADGYTSGINPTWKIVEE